MAMNRTGQLLLYLLHALHHALELVKLALVVFLALVSRHLQPCTDGIMHLDELCEIL